jgi:hypothetical protein
LASLAVFEVIEELLDGVFNDRHFGLDHTDFARGLPAPDEV